MKNAITIDLEDYFHVTAFAGQIQRSDWESCESRVEANTQRCLDLLAESGTHATFFVLGWVAERFPALIRRVAECGHEVACHSYWHRLVYALDEPEFRRDTERAKSVLEDATGQRIRGYRAPSFSVNQSTPWAYEVLAELGFTYDSSVFPVRHPNYGTPESPRQPYIVETQCGRVVEWPMPTIVFAGSRAPVGGGAYLRLLPYSYTSWAIRFLNREEKQSACIYFHPWELDPEQPTVNAGLSSRIRHYVGLRSTQKKLTRLLHSGEFSPLGDLVTHFVQLHAPASTLAASSRS